MGFSCLKSYGRCRWRAGVPGLTFVRVKRFTTDRVEVPPVTTAVRNVAAALLVVILGLGQRTKSGVVTDSPRWPRHWAWHAGRRAGLGRSSPIKSRCGSISTERFSEKSRVSEGGKLISGRCPIGPWGPFGFGVGSLPNFGTCNIVCFDLGPIKSPPYQYMPLVIDSGI